MRNNRYQDKIRNTNKNKNRKTNTKCPNYGKCGACQYLYSSYDEEIEKKNEYIKHLLGEFGEVKDIIRAKSSEYYRCKVTGVLAYSKGQIIAGVYEKGSHYVLKSNSCRLEEKQASLIIADTAALMTEFGYSVYDEDKRRGWARYLQVRVCHDGSMGLNTHYMLTIVTASAAFPSKNNFIKALLDIHPEIETVVQNINSRTDNMILADKENVLYGPGYVTDQLLGKNFIVSSGSFYQINGKQTEILYKTAIDYLELTGEESILDAYCGTGTIGLCAADKVKSIIGVELNPAAVADARKNAKYNKIRNSKFFCQDASEFLHRYVGDENECLDAVIMDPPRAGSTKVFIDSLIKAGPSRVVYVSCNPVTLKRDLKLLARAYEIKAIQPIDMFPRTEHVETVVLMSKEI